MAQKCLGLLIFVLLSYCNTCIHKEQQGVRGENRSSVLTFNVFIVLELRHQHDWIEKPKIFYATSATQIIKLKKLSKAFAET